MKLNQLIRIINHKEIRSTPQKQIIITTFVMIKDIIFYMQSHGPSGTDQSRSSAFSRSRVTQARKIQRQTI